MIFLDKFCLDAYSAGIIDSPRQGQKSAGTEIRPCGGPAPAEGEHSSTRLVAVQRRLTAAAMATVTG